MPLPAGSDEQGELTTDPEQVLKTMRILPMGYWKGSALALLLDLFAAAFSAGNSTAMIGRKYGGDAAVSQVFIAIDYTRIVPPDRAGEIAQEILADLLASEPLEEGGRVVYPGQRRRAVREENLRLGIPVHERVWRKILSLGG